MLKLEGQIDRGDLHFKDTVLDGITAVGCGLSVDEEKRSTFDDCRFSKISAKKCVMGFPIFRRCTFRNVKSDFLGCYGTLFLECKLEGVISGVNFALTTEWVPYSDLLNNERIQAGLESIQVTRQRIAFENLAEAGRARYCLDVRDAIIADVLFNDEAIVPKVLFNRGQCVIYKGSKLQEKLRAIFRAVKDRGLQSAFLPALSRSQTVYLRSLESEGAAERIGEIKSLLAGQDIDLIEEPLCS